MEKAFAFYSKIPSFSITYFDKNFAIFTFDEINNKQTHLNLELSHLINKIGSNQNILEE